MLINNIAFVKPAIPPTHCFHKIILLLFLGIAYQKFSRAQQCKFRKSVCFRLSL